MFVWAVVVESFAADRKAYQALIAKRQHDEARREPTLGMVPHFTRSVWIEPRSGYEGGGFQVNEVACQHQGERGLLAAVARFRPQHDLDWVTASIDCFDQNMEPIIDRATGGHFTADHGCWLGSFAQNTLPRAGEPEELILGIQTVGRPELKCVIPDDGRADENQPAKLKSREIETLPMLLRVTIRAHGRSATQEVCYRLEYGRDGRISASVIDGF